MKISSIAREVDASPSTIRYYERAGILPSAGRDANGQREYSDTDLERIRLVVGARKLGISLEDLREVVAAYDGNEIPSRHILQVISLKVAEVEKRNKKMDFLRHQLLRLRALASKLA